MAGSAVAFPPPPSTSTAAAVAVAAAAAADMPTPATPGVWAVSHREVQRAHGGGGGGAGGSGGGSGNPGSGLAMSSTDSRDERLSGFEVRCFDAAPAVRWLSVCWERMRLYEGGTLCIVGHTLRRRMRRLVACYPGTGAGASSPLRSGRLSLQRWACIDAYWRWWYSVGARAGGAFAVSVPADCVSVVTVSADNTCQGHGDVRRCRHGRSCSTDWYRAAALNVMWSKRKLDDSTLCGEKLMVPCHSDY